MSLQAKFAKIASILHGCGAPLANPVRLGHRGVMTADIKRLLATMAVDKRGYWASAINPDILYGLFKILTEFDHVSGKLKVAHQQPDVKPRFKAMFEDGLALPENFKHRAAWIIFWAVASGFYEISTPANDLYRETELNGGLLTAIVKAFKDFRGIEGDEGDSDCIAVALSNYAKFDQEAQIGADFGLVVEIKGAKRTLYLVSHIQAKCAERLTTNIYRKAGDSTQLQRLIEHGYGRYLFYNHHKCPPGLMPTTKSLEQVKDLPIKGAVGAETQMANVVELADDFAASLAAAASTGITGADRESALPPSAIGYRFVESRVEAMKLLFPNERKNWVPQVLAARVGERRFTPEEIASFSKEWDRAIKARVNPTSLAARMAREGRDQGY